MKRGLSFLLALALCLSLCPVDALALDLGGAAAVGSEAAMEEPVVEESAEEPAEEAEEELAEDAATDKGEVTASGSCGENVTWSLADGVLTISGSGAMEDYAYGGHTPWRDNYDDVITSIVIEEGVTHIGDRAFYYLDKATAVVFPTTVESCGAEAFSECSSLLDVYITDLAAWASIEFEYADANPLYFHAENLYLNGVLVEEAVLPDSVTSIGRHAFHGYEKLTSIVLPSSLEKIGSGAFTGCDNLIDVYIDDLAAFLSIYEYNSDLLTCASHLYLNGVLLEEVEIPDGITSVENWFRGFSGLTRVIIPDSVTSIGRYAFDRCSNLNSVQIGNSVESIGESAFAYCSTLKEIDIPDSVQSIGSDAFHSCTSLETVTLPASVTKIGSNAFGNCTGLNGVYISDLAAWCALDFTWVQGYGDEGAGDPNEVSNPLYFAGNLYLNGNLVEELVIPESVEKIGNNTFNRCRSLKKVVIPDSVVSIGTRAFAQCYSLAEVVIPDSVTSIESYTFADCINLAEVVIPDSVTSIGTYAFSYCRKLQNVVIPDSVTSIGMCAFSDCRGLTGVTIPSIGGPYANSITFKDIFGGCSYDDSLPSGLKSVTVTSSVEDRGFSGCSTLTEITLLDTVTNIGKSAFSGCSGLTEITIPGAVKSVGNSFGGCSGLESIVLEEGVINLSADAFKNLSALKEIHIPATVKNIGAGAFNGCSALTDVYYGGSSTDWDDIVIESDNVALYTAQIHCTEPLPATEAPVISVTSVAASGKPQLSWNAVDGAVKYEVWRAYSKSGTYYKMGTTSGTTYTNSGAEAGKNYYYKVRALNADGIASDYSNIVSRTCDCAQPSFSISCRAESGKPRLFWTAVSGAESYEVWRSTSKNGSYTKMGSTSGTTYTNSSAVAGKTYYYKIRAVGSSSASASVFSTVKNITCDYAQPVVSISCVASTGKPKLTWNAVDGATKYEIWRATSKTGAYSKIYTTSYCYFNNTTAEASKSYYYKVRAIGSSSYASSAYSSMVSITCDCARPSVSITTNASTGKPKLSWSAVSGAVKYEIWRATSRTGTYTKIYTTSNTYFNNTTATANKSYYYKVRAIGTSSYAASAYSSIVSITCDCARPVVTTSTNSSGKPRLNWGAVEGAVKYEIWRSGYRNGTYTKIYTTSNTYFNNTTAKSGYTYFYKVRAIGSSSYATSAYSSIVSAKCK